MKTTSKQINKGPAPAVRSAARILHYLADHPGSRGREIALGLSINPSTCHGILKTLSTEGLVEFDPGSKKYRLGPSLIALGGRAREEADYVSLARPFLHKWVTETNFTIFVAKLLPRGDILVVDKIESNRSIKVTVQIGQLFPLSAAALGRCFLAWMDDGEARALLANLELPAYTEHSVTDLALFMRSLDRVRDLGWSESHREYYSISNAVASPVFDPHGSVAFVVCSLAGENDMPEKDLGRYGSAIHDLALEISQSIWRQGRRSAKSR